MGQNLVVHIRLMISSDLDFAAACTRAEGWLSQSRQGLEDLLVHEPDGSFIAQVDGRPAGMCVATPYERHGFIGMLIVIPDFRGLGLGTLLFTQAVRYLKSRGIRSISLDADAPGIPIYEKAGFRKVCRSLRFNGNVPGASHELVQPMSPADVDAVCSMDNKLFNDDRSFFIRRKFSRNPELCFVAKQDDMLLGYLLAEPGDGVISVGPWAALPELSCPITLLERLMLAAPGGRTRIGVLESNQPAVTLLRSAPGLVESEPSWRMVLCEDNAPGVSRCLYAIGSPAKG